MWACAKTCRMLVVPLFPWRQGVLFPGCPGTCWVARPYEVDLVSDATAGDCLLGVFGLKRRRRIYSCSSCSQVFIDRHSLAVHQLELHGCFVPWLDHPQGREPQPEPWPFPTTLCVAKIRRIQSLPDGGIILRLLGRLRAQVRQQLPVDKPYRRVRVDIVDDVTQSIPPPQGWLAQACRSIQRLRGLSSPDQDPNPPGMWLDLLCHVLPLSWEEKMILLEEPTLVGRYQILANHLPALSRRRGWNDFLGSIDRHLVNDLLPPGQFGCRN